MREVSADRVSRHPVTLRRLARPRTVILVITGLFQVFRGAPIDGAFFLVIAVVLIADEFGAVAVPHTRIPRLSVLAGSAVVLGTLMVLAPRHGFVEGLIVSAIGASVFVFAWPHHGGSVSMRSPLRTAGIIWAVVAVAVCLIEVTSFLLGLRSPTAEFTHPSISLLLDPVLNTIEGRVVFTALWLVTGIALLRRGERR